VEVLALISVAVCTVVMVRRAKCKSYLFSKFFFLHLYCVTVKIHVSDSSQPLQRTYSLLVCILYVMLTVCWESFVHSSCDCQCKKIICT
jgi:hypothetical protein